MDRTSDAAVTYLCYSSAQRSLFSVLFLFNGSVFCVLNCTMSCNCGEVRVPIYPATAHITLVGFAVIATLIEALNFNAFFSVMFRQLQ